MRFLYFAYGSNMLSARLTARCPSAEVIGAASASDHALEFTKLSKDNSGKATLVAENSKGIYTPGVLFEIAKRDLASLDRAEGAGHGYLRHDTFQVRLAGTDEEVAATTYLAINTEEQLKPYDWYLALAVAGARQHRLDIGHVQMLCQTEFCVDGDLTREGRTVALEALAAHGHHDHHQLLRETKAREVTRQSRQDGRKLIS